MPKTLLLADDSVTIQKVVGISFANEDVALVTVDNGDDAVARVRETRPDAVLADVVMPGKSGYEVCEAIKSDPELSHIPVLLLTGTFEAFDEERAQRVGADGHITKPFEAQMLVDRVNALLAGSRGADAAEADASVETAEGDFFDEEASAERSTPEPAAIETPAPAEEDEAFLFDGEFADDAADPLATDADADADEPLSVLDEELPGETTTTLVADDAILEDDLDRTALREPLAADEPLAEAELAGADLGDLDLDDTQGRLRAAMHAEPAEDERPLAADAEAGDDARDEDEETALAEAELAPAPVREPASSDDAADWISDADLEPAPAEPLQAEDLGTELAPAAEPVSVREEPPVASLEEERRSEFDISSSDLGDPLALSGGAPPPQAAAAPETSAARLEASPELRGQLVEVLEKIAWEAFGDLADQLVKQTVAKVEEIAWEVIPQMAESLIRDEIRKLKDEESS